MIPKDHTSFYHLIANSISTHVELRDPMQLTSLGRADQNRALTWPSASGSWRANTLEGWSQTRWTKVGALCRGEGWRMPHGLGPGLRGRRNQGKNITSYADERSNVVSKELLFGK